MLVKDIYFFYFLEGKPPAMPEGTYFKPKFFDFMLAEYTACREGVGIIDMSSFSKIEIKVRFEFLIYNANWVIPIFF